MRYNIKSRLDRVNCTLTDLHIAVVKTGRVSITYADFCRAVKGKLLEPRADKATAIADEILAEMESKL